MSTFHFVDYFTARVDAVEPISFENNGGRGLLGVRQKSDKPRPTLSEVRRRSERVVFSKEIGEGTAHYLFHPLKNITLRPSSLLAITAISRVLVTKIAENMEIKIPMESVKAKP